MSSPVSIEQSNRPSAPVSRSCRTRQRPSSAGNDVASPDAMLKVNIGLANEATRAKAAQCQTLATVRAAYKARQGVVKLSPPGSKGRAAGSSLASTKTDREHGTASLYSCR